MQKLIIFSPIIIFFTIFFALIGGFLIVIAKLLIKGRASSWEGKLVDKFHKTSQDFDTNQTKHYYTLVFETTKGKQVKIGTTKSTYDTYQIGDQAIKEPGKFHIRKLA